MLEILKARIESFAQHSSGYANVTVIVLRRPWGVALATFKRRGEQRTRRHEFGEYGVALA
jgi:hypothetical protein